MLRDNYIQAKVPANGIRDVDQGRAFAVKEPGSPHDLSNRKIPQPTCLVSRRSHARYDSTVVRDRERTTVRSEEHTSELQSPHHIVCRLLPEKKNELHGFISETGGSYSLFDVPLHY